MLANVIKGKIQSPHFVLIYGTDSVGKTTFGASAPNPIFLEMENGSDNLDVARLKIKSLREMNLALDDLLNEKHDYKTVVVDSLDWLEPLVWADVCANGSGKEKSIEDFGYGKGYVLALNQWQVLIATFKKLREVKKMNVILIAHSHVKAFNDPSQPQSYDRYQLKLNDKAAALWREAVDAVLFATFETFVKKDGLKGKAYGDGKRIMFTERRPSFDAKNRMGLPFELDLSWSAYIEAQNSAKPDALNEIKKEIEDLISACDKADKKKVMESAYKKAGDNAEELKTVLSRIRITLGG